MSRAAQRRFVLIDRDGTLIVGHHYLSDPDRVELLPGVAAGLRAMRQLGLGLVVVTNQSAVGRGLFDLARLERIHQRLEALLAVEGLRLDGLYLCPHRPEEDCRCRKPRTGLVESAAAEHGFDPARSFVIGDDVCDVELGQACGASTLLVTSGHGERVLREGAAAPDHVVRDLVEAATVIRDILDVAGASTGNRIA
jgi:D-glycero-D-manno-heptose 1,7-bisphosphate phosphatase